MEIHRGEVDVRGLITGETRRRSYVDIGEVKRRLESNTIDRVRSVVRFGMAQRERGVIEYP